MAGDVSDGVGPLFSLFRAALVGDSAGFSEQLTETMKAAYRKVAEQKNNAADDQ